jgi:diaminohydroxyphosphoribosylaminopyrimidine deaminase/5-amino-6-(5-phosphoribosylamino)uracil reductase
MLTTADRLILQACLRYALRHRSLTGTNPSVGTLLVKDGVIVGRGITAKGGRPHAERVAIDNAGERARGSTAYVSLEPCAHHGTTPPCAQALIDAGIVRVVTAWTDPDRRVDGKGHDMLRRAGIEVVIDDQSNSAPRDMSGYLNRKLNNRPQVTLKLAISADGMLGIAGQEMTITGDLARRMVHRLRAEHDAILVGRGTVDSDDPELTCRLPGLQSRSPHRFVLDTSATMSSKSKLARSANQFPVSLVSGQPVLASNLLEAGVRLFTAEVHDELLALPEFLEDLAGTGISSLMVEGGAKVAASFLNSGLVDEIWLFSSPAVVGKSGTQSPITPQTITEDFRSCRLLHLADDTLEIWQNNNMLSPARE